MKSDDEKIEMTPEDEAIEAHKKFMEDLHSKLHRRNAERLLRLLQRNKGLCMFVHTFPGLL
jgi:hypothetical protein